MPDNEFGLLLIIVVLVLLSSFFSSSETAFFSLQNTARLKHLVSIGDLPAIRVSRMLDEPGRLLSTILLGNNLANVAFTALLTTLGISLLNSEGRGILAATTIGTVVVLVFGEIVPKTFAVRYSESIAFSYARPLKWIEVLLFPLVVVFEWISRLASIGTKYEKGVSSITEGELRTLIDLGEAEGEFEPEEAEMLESVFRFTDRQVRDIVTPRTEVVFIERGVTLRKFLGIYTEKSYTRFPVYKGSPDNVVGILSTKDILKGLAAKGMSLDDSVTDVIRDAYFVPETKRIVELFDELRQSGNQMAIAIDEYGGIAGLVTLKRLLEEVVGRVGEEGASPEDEIVQICENTFQVDGRISIDEVKEKLDLEIEEGEFETIAGFVLKVLGHIPIQGETLEYRALTVEVTRVRDLRIERLTLTKRSKPKSIDVEE